MVGCSLTKETEMTKPELNGYRPEALGRHRSPRAARRRLVTSIVIFLVCLAIVVGFSVLGSVVEGGITLSQDEVSSFCLMPSVALLPDAYDCSILSSKSFLERPIGADRSV
jgi:hypothetical protein